MPPKDRNNAKICFIHFVLSVILKKNNVSYYTLSLIFNF